jgi:geranylgeranyl pyrophosphate synthase
MNGCRAALAGDLEATGDADPRAHGVEARAAHSRSDRASGGRGRQAHPPDADARGRAALRLRGADHRKLAATVEFIHTATLLHDDVVDESQRRRGRPTANLLWDNKSSVLVGDYLFARAFQLMVETQNLRVLDILSNAAATIAEGEVLQLTAAMNLATTEDIYLQVIRGKTAALFEAACEVGGVIAGSRNR